LYEEAVNPESAKDFVRYLEPGGCRASKAVHGNKPPLLRKFDLLHWLS
jgi:hypothetical protein